MEIKITKPKGYVYLPGSKFRQEERNLELRSCLHDDVVNDAPHVGKYINKYELYRQCPPMQLNNTIMNYIDNAFFV